MVLLRLDDVETIPSLGMGVNAFGQAVVEIEPLERLSNGVC
jgi:hypothetical protein